MGNWYCRNCQSYQDSWAEHQSYKKDEEYRRDKRCWSCDKLRLRYTDSQKEHYERLVKQRTSVSGTVYQVKRFSTWWSNNIATAVVYYSGYYRVFLLVYVKENDTVKVFPESYDCIYWGDSSRGRKNHDCSSDAKSEASWLRSELSSSYGKYHDNPILLIHPCCDCSRSFNTFVNDPYVWKREVGSSFCFSIPLVITVGAYQVPSSLNDYFKVGDVIRVKKINHIVGKTYFHVGVYLGNGKICHISDPAGLISEENLKVRITDWDNFLNGWLGTPVNGRAGELQRYRPIIPFKYYKKSIEQAIKSWWVDYSSGKYDLYNDNCEHFANSIIFGTYYSQQIADNNLVENVLGKTWDQIWTKNHNFFWKIFQPNHWGTIWRDAPIINLFNSKRYKVNNGKGSSINLRDEINSWDSNGRFDNLTSYKSDRAEEYEEQYLIQIPPKDNCRIM